MGKKITLGGMKFYSTSENKKTGEKPTLVPGTEVKGLKYLETTEAPWGKFGGLIHKFLDNDGNRAVFNGSGMLNKLMEQISPGDVVNIKYLGKQPCQSGPYAGSMAHTYEMEYADEVPTIDTSSVSNKVDDDEEEEAF